MTSFTALLLYVFFIMAMVGFGISWPVVAYLRERREHHRIIAGLQRR